MSVAIEQEGLIAAVEQISDGIVITDTQGNIQYVNPAFTAMTGYTDHEILGKNPRILQSGCQSATFYDELWATIRHGGKWNGEVTNRRKDGTLYVEEMRISTIRDSNGQISGHIAIKHDVTERMRADTALRESEENFRTLADSCPSMMWVTNAAGEFQFINKACREFVGATATELRGNKLRLLIHPDDQPACAAAFSLATVCQTSFSVDCRIRRLDGDWRMVGSKAEPRLSLAGEYIGHIGLSADITKRRLDEAVVRDAQKFAQSTIDALSSHICVLDESGTIIAVNKKWRDFAEANWKESPGECAIGSQPVGNSSEGVNYLEVCENVTGPEAAESSEFARGIRSVLRQECERHSKEYRCNSHGEVTWFVGTATRFVVGDMPRILVEHINITERKIGEEALRTAKRKAETEAHQITFQNSLITAIQEVSPDGILVVNTEGAIVSHNTKFLDVWKLPPSIFHREARNAAAAISDNIVLSECINKVKNPEEFVNGVRELYADLTAEDHCEIALKDGRTLERHSAGLRGEAQRHQGRVWFFRDITSRKIAEDALRSSEEKFRQIAENIKEVFWMMDATGSEILYIAPGYEQIWGRTCESVYKAPKEWLGSIHEDDRERAHATFLRQLQGEVIDSEYRITTPDGHVRWIRDRAFPVHDPEGHTVRIVGVAEEVTEQRLYQMELVKAREDANAANHAKSRFLANMSHEIRTPMNGVIGMNQLLAQTELTVEQRRYVEVAQNSGRALLTLIDDILDLSKIEAGKITLMKTSFDLNRLVEEVIQVVQVQADAKGLHIGSHVARKIPKYLRGDSDRLRQILTNLCANAVKFTAKGGISLVAELQSRCDRTTVVRFAITDSGIGISPDGLKKLFVPFAQADVSTTRKYGGTGLGLAISKQLAELMGGEIGVKSSEGKGSTFWFTAIFENAVHEGGELAEERAKVSSSDSGLLRSGMGQRILVAEDNAVNREVIVAQLRKLNYRADAVLNGAEAVEAVEYGNYDLVLMDCEMPLMDGYVATYKIRSTIQSKIPIIALTANAMATDKERCLREGMDDYLAKPVELLGLASMLVRWAPVPGPANTPPKPLRLDRQSTVTFDEASLLRRLLGDKTLARIVIQAFLHDAPSRLDELRTQLDKLDVAGIKLPAHTLKGASATVGANSLCAVASAIEAAAATGQSDCCRDLLVRATEELERFYMKVKCDGWVEESETNFKLRR